MLAAKTPARIEGQEAVYRGGLWDARAPIDHRGASRFAIDRLRCMLAGAGW